MSSVSIKKFFIPHKENGYRPHLLHTKRAVFYSFVFLLMKGMVVAFALLVPQEAFLLPNVLAQQEMKLVTLTNLVRAQKGLPAVTLAPKLHTSADARATDMASNQYFSHVGPNGHTFPYFLSKADYHYHVAGEDLAMGFSDADSVMNAWMKSATHYAVLVDPDFRELGVAVESGFYHGQPTVFVAEHFGDPIDSLPIAPFKNVHSATRTPEKNVVNPHVQGVKVVSTENTPTAKVDPFVFDRSTSFVSWKDQGDSTLFHAQAKIDGDVKSAVVTVSNYPIELKKQTDGSTFVGDLLVHEPVDNFFRTIVLPAITITASSGEVLHDTIDWQTIKLVSETPLQKYIRAKNMLAPFSNVFPLSRGIYLAFLVFFSLALIINIVIEVRHQHYHTIIQTLFLIGLILFLYWV